MRKRLLLTLLLTASCAAQVFSNGVTIKNGAALGTNSGNVLGASAATATQFVMTYSATNSNQCAIEVSESNTYSPVVNVVNSALFTNANLDAQTNVGSRVFVIGKRTTALALDSKYYSQALQANTTHYYRISTCVSSPLTGSFSTGNIPAGRTFADLVPMSAGSYLIPTTTGANGESFIDPITGAKVIRLGSTSDDAKGYDWFSSGSVRTSSYLSDSGGYYTLGITDDGFTRMYWVNTTTGASAYLGYLKNNILGANYFQPASLWDPLDAKSMWITDVDVSNKAHLVHFTYSGSRVNGESATVLGAGTDYTPTNTIPDLLHTYDATFDIIRYGTKTGGAQGCSLVAVQKVGSNVYGYGQCQLYQQNSAAWSFVLNLTSPVVGSISVVSAYPVYAQPKTRWCGNHSVYNVGDSKQTYYVFDPFQYPADSSAKGPWEISMTAAVTTTGQTAFSVSGEPVASGSGIPPDGNTSLQNMAVGDEFVFEDNGEKVKITTKTNSTTLVVARGCTNANGVMTCDGTGATTHSNGAKLWATCVPWGVDAFVDPVTDPTGANILFDSHMQGGHRVTRDELFDFMEDINGGLPYKTGKPADVAVDALLDVAPSFSGQVSPASGNAYIKHPSMEASGLAYDMWNFAFNGSWTGSNNLTLVAGKTNIYKYDKVGVTFDFSKLPYFALAGTTLLQDISGTSSSLPDAAVNKVCVAGASNECVSGSVANDVYVTFSTLPTYLGCAAGGEGALAGNFCMQHTTPYGHAFTQFKLAAGNTTGTGPAPNSGVPVYGAKNNRVILRGLLGYYSKLDNYPNGHPMPDNSWATLPLRLDGANDRPFLVKIPPAWTDDGVDRTGFINQPVVLTGGATYVSYGYEENGARSAFYCTQAQTVCKVTGTTGTTVQVPAIPGRVVFTQLQGSSSITAIAVP